MGAKTSVVGYAVTLWVVEHDTPCVMRPLSATALDGSFPVYGKPGMQTLTVRLQPGMLALRVPSTITVNPASFVRVALVDERGNQLTHVPSNRIIE